MKMTREMKKALKKKWTWKRRITLYASFLSFTLALGSRQRAEMLVAYIRQLLSTILDNCIWPLYINISNKLREIFQIFLDEYRSFLWQSYATFVQLNLVTFYFAPFIS